MINEHPYPACPICGGVEFDNIPDFFLEGHRLTSLLGLAAHSRVGGWVVNLVVCNGCGKTDVYTKNVDELRARVPGATRFRATQRAPT